MMLLARIGSFVLLLAFAPRTALACSCSPPPPVPQALREARAVFAGRCVAARLLPKGELCQFTFEVQRTWKGIGGAKRVTVTTPSDSGMCGYGFHVGTAYIVYCEGAGRDLSTNLCTRTRQYGGIWNEDEERALDAATRKRRNTKTPNHAMERTATRRALTFPVTKISSLRSSLALGGRRSSWSR